MISNHLLQQVPNLTTALTGPLLELERHLLKHQIDIECWLRQQWQHSPPPFTCSVDLRNAGFKLAPVDTNLFPAGFNNLNPEFMSLCIQAVQSLMQTRYPHMNRILIIPESHTRNFYYLENLYLLQQIFINAGFDAHIGSLIEELKEPMPIKLPSEHIVILEPIEHKDNILHCGDFIPELIILNNDLSEGTPDILNNIKQPITPPTELGWSKRLKSKHFTYYDEVISEFSKLIDIDPWLINPSFRYCGEVDFLKHEGEECVVYHATQLFKDIQEKYDEYHIKHEPFIVIKADQGTYGMGVMAIKSIEELKNLNRKQRTKMAKAKGSQKISKVILQEGVYTFEHIGDEQAVAEPVIYMIGSYVVGGFYRVHKKRGQAENLNAPGMEFEPLAFANPCNTPNLCLSPNEDTNRFYAYGVIARLALLAAARENKEAIQ